MTIELPATELVTPEVRLTFPSLFEPTPTMRGGDKLAYQATLLIPPGPVIEKLKGAATAALVEKFGRVPDRLSPNGNPIRKCDEKPTLDGFEPGWFFVKVRSGPDYPPTLVDQKRQPILDVDRLFAGVWVHAHIGAWAWDHATGGKGVSFNLNALQLVRSDTRLRMGGQRPANDIFGDVEVEDSAEAFGDGVGGESSVGGSVDDLFA